jgi:hypothetical protein
LNEPRTCLAQLQHGTPKQIGQNEAYKVEVLREFEGKSRGQAIRGLRNHGIRKSSGPEKQKNRHQADIAGKI